MKSLRRFFREVRRRRVARVAAVYVAAAFALLEGLDILIPSLGLPEVLLSAAAYAAVVGFPIALLLGWVFDLGSEGVIRTAPEADGSLIQEGEAWMPGGTLVIATAFLLVGVAAGWWTRGGAGSGDLRSVAVLPFTNLSGDPENEYFSDGITEEVLTHLATSQELRVAARTSSFSFKGKNASVSEIADALGVDAIVEGSVRREAARISITATLVNASDGFQIWTNRFERNLSEVFDVQEEIASAIAIALGVTEGVSSGGRQLGLTENLEAYDLYLLGRSRWWTRSVPAMFESIQFYEQALAKDPGFALAYTGLAHTYMLLPTYALEDVNNHEMFGKAREAVARARALAPDLAEVEAALGFIALYYDWELGPALDHLSRAVEMAPSDPNIHNWYGAALRASNQKEDGLSAAKKTVELDPLAAIFHFNLGLSYMRLGRDEEAEAAMRRGVELDAGNLMVVSNLIQFLALKDRPDEATKAVAELMPEGFRPTFGLWARALEDSELRPQVIDAFRALEEATPLTPAYFVPFLMHIDAFDEALAGFQHAVDTRSWTIAHATEPQHRPLWADERFLALLEETGFPPPK